MSDMNSKAVSGVAWIGTAAALTAGLQFFQLAILAYLLAPSDFGLMAMVMLVIGLAQVFLDMGVSNAIIHRQDSKHEELSSLYWLNILAGITLFVLAQAGAPLAASLFGEPRLTELTRWACLAFLIAPFGQQFQILLQKELRFRTLSLIETGGAVAGFAISVSCALDGQGVYSLVWGYLGGGACTAAMFCWTGWRNWRPKFRFRRVDLQGYLGFGLYQMGERILNYLAARLDYGVIGAFMGAEALGFYNLAHYLTMMPYQRLNPVLTRVAFPLMARMQCDNDRLKKSFMVLQRIISTTNFPILFGLAATAPAFVLLVYGEKWYPAIGLIQILVFVAAFRSIINPTGSLMLAKGRADMGFYWTILVLAIQIPAVYLGVRHGGAEGIAVAMLAVQILGYTGNYLVNIRALVGRCFREHLASIVPALVTSSMMGVVVLSLQSVTDTWSWPTFLLQVLAGVVLYILFNWLFFRQESLRAVRLVLAWKT